jgi:hypothetical protein
MDGKKKKLAGFSPIEKGKKMRREWVGRAGLTWLGPWLARWAGGQDRPVTPYFIFHFTCFFHKRSL